jgi:WhiB family redox-sensing transcriptional regulator
MKAVTKELQRLRRRPQPWIPPMPWAARAACQAHDPEHWMDGRPGYPTAAARAVCAACPVHAACLAHALAYDEPWGMWGGLTTRERIASRLGLPLLADDDAERPYSGANGPRKTKPSGTRRAS